MSVKKFTRKQLAFADGGYAQELANQNPELLKDKVFQMALNDERQSQASALQSDWEQAQHDAAWSRGHVLTPSQQADRAKEMADLVGRTEALGIGIPGGNQKRREALPMPTDFTPTDISPSLSQPPAQPKSRLAIPDIKVAPGIGESDLTGISSGIGGDPMPLGLTYANGGSIINRRDGGPIAGGPPGVDTVPGKVGDKKVLLNNGEYVLPQGVVKKIGKDRLDGMVTMMTGKTPVGYEWGGLLGQFDRKKQLNGEEQKAISGPVKPDPKKEEPSKEEPSGSSIADIMKEIRTKHPSVKYATGGLLYDPRYAVAVDPKKYQKQDPNAPDYPNMVPMVGLPDPDRAALIQARKAQQARQGTNIGNLAKVAKSGEGMPAADVLSSIAGATSNLASPSVSQEIVPAPAAPALLPKPVQDMTESYLDRPSLTQEDISKMPSNQWNYSQGSMGELVAKNPRGEATFYPGTGAGRTSPIGLDAATMQEAARNIASGKPPGGMVSYVSGPGSYGMSEAEWKALPNDQKIARNVEYYNNAAKAVRDVTNTQRAYEGRPAVGAENMMPLRPSDQIAMASLQERAQNNAIARGIAAENARAVGLNAAVNKGKAIREMNKDVQTEIDNMPVYGALPRDLLWAQVSQIANKKKLSPEYVNQKLALYLASLGFANKYENTPEQYAKLEEALKAFEVGLK